MNEKLLGGKRKKLLSLLLAFAMVVALLPMSNKTVQAASGTALGTSLGSNYYELDSGTYYLSGDTTGNIRIKSGATVTLDLNGYVLQAASNPKSVIQNLGNLTVIDSNSSGLTHYFTYNAAAPWTYIGDSASNAVTLDQLLSGSVTPTSGSTVVAISGGCITGGQGTVNNTQTFGGGICNNKYLKNSSSDTNGGNANLNFAGGYIIGNGGASYLTNCQNYDEHSYYTNNESSQPPRAGGIAALGNGTVNMTGGAIVGNATVAEGGAVYVEGTDGMSWKTDVAKFNMTGGLISYNVSASWGAGAINSSGNISLTGGKIIKNSSGLGFDGNFAVNAANLTVGGSIIITDNKNNVGNEANVKIKKDKTITVSTPSATMNVGVTSEVTPTEASSVYFTGTNGADYSQYFYSDVSTYAVFNVGNKLCLKPHTHSWSYSASGATITAACSGTPACPRTDTSLTIKKPAHSVYGDGKSAEATLSAATLAEEEVSASNIKYYAKNDSGTYSTTALSAAPTDAGDYKACITVGGKTASVEYTVNEVTVSGVTVASGISDPGITYDGSPVTIEEIISGTPLIDGEAVSTTTYKWKSTTSSTELTSAPTDVGDYEVLISYTNSNRIGLKTIAFKIIKADQDKIAESSLTVTDESLSDANDGKIAGVCTDYEYSTDNGTNWVACAGTEITGLSDGTVMLRKKGTSNYNPSESISVTIGSGSKIKLSVPDYADYDMESDSESGYDYGEDATLTFIPRTGYTVTEPLVVTVGGVETTFTKDATTGNYTATFADLTDKEGLKVTNVSGYGDITAPKATLSVATNSWENIINTVTFGTFFKASQIVKADVSDEGSGLASVQYYVSHEYMTESEVKALSDSDWNTYTDDGIKLDPDDKYVVYLKATDNKGNISYVSTDGMVFDTIAPLVTGLTDKAVYCSSVSFEVEDTNLDSVKLDGEVIEANNGEYTITADNKKHNVVIADKAGNSVTYQVTVNADHTKTAIGQAKAATCTEDGITAGVKCSACNTIIEEQEVIPATGHDFSGEWTVTKEATSTTDGEKETICKNGCGVKKVDIIPATGKKEDDSSNGHIAKYALVACDAPVESASLDNSKTELMNASGIFTEAEKTAIKNGQDAKVYLQIENVYKTDLSAADQNQMESAAGTALGNNSTIEYMAVSLFKQVGDADAVAVHEPGIAIKVTIKIPSNMLVSQKGMARKYRILRLHDGKVETISGNFDFATNQFTFSTDKFSTYAIAYSDEEMKIEISTPRNNTNLANIGDTLKLSVTVTPANDANQEVTYKSSDEKVVTVDKNGRVTAVGKGKAVITVTTADGSVSNTITITVGEKSSVPATGDVYNIWLCMLLMIESLGVISLAMLKRKED